MRIGTNRQHTSALLIAIVALVGLAPLGAQATDGTCSNEFVSTFAAIQRVVFETHGCASQVCHGAAIAGGLDLRAGAAYGALVDRSAQSVPGARRVVPGQTEDSLLFINLAARTLPAHYHAPLRAMPPEPLVALTADELEAVRLWIQAGAPRQGVVAGTASRLDACLPPPAPVAIAPLPPPAAGDGVQLHMPRWVLEPHSEHEVCFATYFDFTEQVPAAMRDASGTKMRIQRSQIRQDSLSHHLFAGLYSGEVGPDDPIWGTFLCRGGSQDGQPCNAAAADCAGGGICATSPRASVGCIGFGPADAQFGFNTFGITGTQETAIENRFTAGVYIELPLKGMALWSSHAFNLTDTEGPLQAWINLHFAPPTEQNHLVTTIFDAGSIFKMTVPAFETQEVCGAYKLPDHARLFELSSHVHRHGKRFRTFLGAFTCDGGPKNGAACSPLGTDFVSPDLCAGAPCRSTRTLHVGDCNYDDLVTVDELVIAVNVALGTIPMADCFRLDANSDRTATVDELVKAVNSALTGAVTEVTRDPAQSLLYLNLEYSDPVVVRFDPPIAFPGPQGTVDEHALTYCSLYDNGYVDAGEVKTRSGSPPPPLAGLGGPCQTPTHCVTGNVTAPCSGSNSVERNASCDSVPGAADGLCDACTLRGGVTTEDEMFLLLGSYFVP